MLVLPELLLGDPGANERIDAWRRAVPEETLESLIARIDAALHWAKAAGRNRVEVGAVE